MNNRLKLAKRTSGKEQYYTLPAAVDLCVATALPFINDYKLLEPAGGTGEFIKGMIRAGVDENRIISYDIEPKYPTVQYGNFLETKLDHDQYFTLTNPPFGRANSLSVKFFNHAASYSSYIGFLIPKSWRKWSVLNKLDPYFHLIKDVDMPAEAFYNDVDGTHKAGGLQTIFQLYEKRSDKRELIKPENRGYLIKSNPMDADVAIVLFGYSSGRVEREFERVPNTTKGYFKVADESVIDVLELLDYKKFNQNVAYTPALSFGEINHLINEYLDGDGINHRLHDIVKGDVAIDVTSFG